MSSAKIDYTELQQELAQIIDKLQSTNIDIDEAQKAHKRGLEIIEILEKYLLVAENEVVQINKKS